MMNEEHSAEVVTKVLAGDCEAYREIINCYQGRLYSCAIAITRNPEDAADVVQEVFIRFYRHLEQFDSRRPLLPYLLKISVNVSRSLLRRRNHRLVSMDDENSVQIHQHADGHESPFETLERGEQIKLIQDSIQALPLMLREVCSLFYLSDLSCAEVAGILNTNENSVKVALHRARKKLLHSCLIARRA